MYNLKKIIKFLLPYGIVRLYQNRYLFISKNIDHQNIVAEKQNLTSKIEVLNLQINDNCNSRCVMCNIWKQPRSKNFLLEDFIVSLQDPLFINVKYVMLTGGEPTLVKNIVDYYHAIVSNLKQLNSISFTTNCLLHKKALADILAIQELCQENNINFTVALSLDGIGEIHDRNRGVPGNFNKVLYLINNLKKNNVNFFTSTTITSCNVWDVEKILAFLKHEQLYGVFRIAGFVDRLYNNNNSCIRNFTIDEVYQLQLFFNKLIIGYHEISDELKNVYYNIQYMISGGKRIIGCPHLDHKIVTMGHCGDLRHCSPRGKVFCLLPKESGLVAYEQSEEFLTEIAEKYCLDCIHDTHGKPLKELIEINTSQKKWKEFFLVNKYYDNANSYPAHVHSVTDIIFIIGWYGTETVGDKAILAGILQQYKQQNPNIKIAVSSLYPFVTKRTLYELSIEATVIPVYSELFFEYASSAQTVCVGGGPLMELEELSLILWGLSLAKKNNHATCIWGCGIGPLYSQEKYSAVAEILKMADTVMLRDEVSKKIAVEMTEREDIQVIEDPSIVFLQKFKGKSASKQPILACFLRELTAEYRGQMSGDEFVLFKDQFELALAMNIREFCQVNNLKPHFYAMHNFVIGNDDRDYNYQFTNKYFSDFHYYVENKLSTIETIALAMKSSQVNLCMRFHSVVFADTLDTSYIAIDYTNGGKIQAFITEHKKKDNFARMQDLMLSKDFLKNTFCNHVK